MSYKLYELLDKSFSKSKFNRFGPGGTTHYAIFLNIQLHNKNNYANKVYFGQIFNNIINNIAFSLS